MENTPQGAGAPEPASATPADGTPANNSQVTTIEAFQQEIERLKAERKAANDEAAKYRIEKKQREEAEMAAKGQLAELNATLQAERDALNAKIAAIEAENTDAKTKLATIEQARRAELLAKLPADKATKYATVEMGLLEEITKDFATPPPSGNSVGNQRGNPAPTAPSAVPTVPFAGQDAPIINLLAQVLES